MTNERGSPLRCVHTLSRPAILELPECGAWQVVAEPDRRGMWGRALLGGRSSWATLGERGQQSAGHLSQDLVIISSSLEPPWHWAPASSGLFTCCIPITSSTLSLQQAVGILGQGQCLYSLVTSRWLV